MGNASSSAPRSNEEENDGDDCIPSPEQAARLLEDYHRRKQVEKEEELKQQRKKILSSVKDAIQNGQSHVEIAHYYDKDVIEQVVCVLENKGYDVQRTTGYHGATELHWLSKTSPPPYTTDDGKDGLRESKGDR